MSIIGQRLSGLLARMTYADGRVVVQAAYSELQRLEQENDRQTIKIDHLRKANEAFLRTWERAGPLGSHQFEKFDHAVRMAKIAADVVSDNPHQSPMGNIDALVVARARDLGYTDLTDHEILSRVHEAMSEGEPFLAEMRRREDTQASTRRRISVWKSKWFRKVLASETP